MIMQKNINLGIFKETEKAVAVRNIEYTTASEVAKYDVKELTYEQKQVLRNESSLIWLPKSQIEIENNCVVFIPNWLAEKYHILTETLKESIIEKQNARINNYNNILNFAKDNGLKVRNKMKLNTILEVIAKAGLRYEAKENF